MPQDLLRKKGVADEQLAKAEQERGRKYERGRDARSSKRPRSSSSASSMSVETISTNESESKGPSSGAPYESSTVPSAKHERKRKIFSQSKDSSAPSDEAAQQRDEQRASSRSTRRRIGDLSPPERGRRRSRTHSRGRRSTFSNDKEYPRQINPEPKYISTAAAYDSDPPTRLDSRRPLFQRAWRNPSTSGEARRNYRDDSRSRSRDSYRRTHSTFQREDEIRSLDIGVERRTRDRSAHRASLGRQLCLEANVQQNKAARDSERRATDKPHGRISGRASQRERSLSPFSKRLALTQTMNMGQ